MSEATGTGGGDRCIDLVWRLIARLAGLGALLAALFIGAGTALAGGGCDVKTETTDAAGTLVTLQDCGFAPVVLRAPVGAAVTWSNNDAVPHAIHGLAWGMPDRFDVLKGGATFQHTFKEPGVYPYMCYVHPGMSGVVIVGDVAAAANGGAAAPAAPVASPAEATASAPLTAVLVIGSGLIGYGLALLRRTAAPHGSAASRVAA